MLRALLMLYGIGALGAYAVEALPAGTRGMGYVFLHVMLCLICGAIAWQLRGDAARGARSVVVLAVLTRLSLLGVTPYTTHDVHRYTWDGKVALTGADPYRVTPDDSHYATLYDEGWYVAPEHRPYPTIYPPLALSLFSLSALGGPAMAGWIWKFMVTLAAIGIVLLAWRISALRGYYEGLVWVALHPLGLLEAGVGAHVDSVAALGVALAVFGWAAGRGALLGAGLGLGVVTKLTPLIMVGGLFGRTKSYQAFIWVAAVVALVYGTAMAVGWMPLGSLPEFAQSWRFGSVVDWSLSQFNLSRHPGLSPFLLLGGWAWLWRYARGLDFCRLSMAFLGWAFFVSPVLFPWYLVVLLPLLSIAPSAILIGWLSIVPFTYEVIDAFDSSGVWRPSEWPMWATLITLALGIAIDYRRGFWTVSDTSQALSPPCVYGV